MKSAYHQSDQFSRREFLRRTTCASMGLTGVISSLTNLRMMGGALAQGDGAGAGAKAALKELVEGESVSIRYVKELGLDETGLPYVNMAVGPALKRLIVNIELVTAGVADYDFSRARSTSYDANFIAALDAAKKGQQGMWAGIAVKTTAPAAARHR